MSESESHFLQLCLRHERTLT